MSPEAAAPTPSIAPMEQGREREREIERERENQRVSESDCLKSHRSYKCEVTNFRLIKRLLVRICVRVCVCVCMPYYNSN